MSARLESARLVLTPLQFTDANDLHQAVRESLTELKDQFAWAEDPFTIRNAQSIVQESIANQKEGKLIAYGIRSKTGRFMGTLTLKETPDMLGRKVPMHQVELWVRTPDKGQNYGAEALQIATESMLKSGESKRIFAYLQASDAATAQGFQQAGFQNEGTLKNASTTGHIIVAARTI